MPKFLKLVEDAISDRKQREAAKTVVRKLKNYVERRGEEAFRELSPNRKYIIVASDFMDRPTGGGFPPGFNPSKVRFYFGRGRRGSNPSYTRDNLAGDLRYSVKLPFLTRDGSLERIADKIAVRQDAIIHELVHLFDDLRTGADDLIDMRQAGGEYADKEEGYYNEPFELNAYFQQAIGDFEEFVERSPETLAALSGRMKDFRSFQEFAFDQLFDDGFIENLTDENRERIIKRLYQFYEDFRKSQLFQKHVTS